MSTNSFFLFFNLLPPWGGCPNPWACGAYPKAGHDDKSNHHGTDAIDSKETIKRKIRRHIAS